MKIVKIELIVINVILLTSLPLKTMLNNYLFVIYVIIYSINLFCLLILVKILKLVNVISVCNCFNDFMFFKKIITILCIALVAQLVAHQTSNLRVAGSIPVWCDFFAFKSIYNYYKLKKFIYSQKIRYNLL